MTATAELHGAPQNRERPRIWDLVTQGNEVQSRQRCSQIWSLRHYLANEVVLSRGPLLPHIPEIVVERKVLLLSDRRIRFFSVSDTWTSTDRSLSCIESVETKKRAANARPIMFDSDTNRDWEISSSGDKNSKTSNSPTTTKAIPPVLTSTKSKWETRKARPGRRRSFVSCLLRWERRVYISILLRIYDRKIRKRHPPSGHTDMTRDLRVFCAQLWSWIVYIEMKKMISYCFDHRHNIFI